MKRTTDAPEIGKYYWVFYDGHYQPAIAIEFLEDVFFRMCDEGVVTYWRNITRWDRKPLTPPIVK